MFRSIFTFLALTIVLGQLPAQDTILYWPKMELGMNITQTLSGFFNAGSQGLATDPYLFSVKFPGIHSAIRTSFNARLRNREEATSTGQRLINDRDIHVRVGMEWRKMLNKRFSFFYGIDAIMRYQQEKVDFNTGGGTIGLGSNSTGFGGGPLLGLMFHITPRVLLTTESSFYALVSSGVDKDQIDPGTPPTEQKIRQFELLPSIPNSLYVFFRF